MANEQLFVEEDQAILTGAATGAAAGAVGGAYGALAGGIIGAGIGLFNANSQNDATRKAAKKRDEAIYKANLLKNAAKKQTEGLLSSSNNLQAKQAKQAGSTNGQAAQLPASQISNTGSIGEGLASSGTF